MQTLLLPVYIISDTILGFGDLIVKIAEKCLTEMHSWGGNDEGAESEEEMTHTEQGF